MNTLEVASPIVDFWVTPNGQHVFIATAKSNWEISSRLSNYFFLLYYIFNKNINSFVELVEICQKIAEGDTSPFVLQYESYCVPPLGPPQYVYFCVYFCASNENLFNFLFLKRPLGFGDFLLFVSMCNSGRYCPSFDMTEVDLVGPGNYTYMPGKVVCLS